ncbi:MAG: FkbM family methyltransferase [Selenomonas bovis]|nr:FkbM family methyltransferase [Selenomonas bovis]
MTEKEFVRALRQNQERVQDILAHTDKLVLVGAGNTCTPYEKSFAVEKMPIVGIVDNSPEKIGKCFLGGVKCTPAKDITDDFGTNSLGIITTVIDGTYWALQKQMQELGVMSMGVDAYIFARHIDELLQCFRRFEDDESRDLYAKIILWRITHRKPAIPFPYTEPYFSQPEFVSFSEQEVFVDMGAYVGDTVERYLFVHLGVFGRIYAFEPDPKNFAALQARTERLKREWALDDEQIVLVPAGVGRKSMAMQMVCGSQGPSTNFAEASDTDDDAVQVVALDDYFEKQKVSFLKTDIESFEYDMLRGAEKILRRDRPKIAICIYHNATDMYRVMLWLDSLQLGYRFRCGHHSVTTLDTILYAY